jgi:hypothetical protein
MRLPKSATGPQRTGPARSTAGPALRAACLALGLACGAAAAQAPTPPPTDVFLVTVRAEEGRVGLGELVAVAEREGYDNQPAFLPDGSIVYSSARAGGGIDIFRFDPRSRETTTVVSTPESEYSPTPVPDAEAISVVRDYGGGNQQLWRFPLSEDGSPMTSLLPDVNPVGYHAWIDHRRLLVFVLGEPATLRIATVGPGAGRVVAERPGRCLARIPAVVAAVPLEMSFVRKVTDDEWWLEALDPESGSTRRLVRTLPGIEDYAWSPDGMVFMADGSRLFRWRPGEEAWTEIADLGARGLRKVTRMAFDPRGARLAIVAER